MAKLQKIISIIAMTCTILMFQNCAKYDFKASDAEALSQGDSPQPAAPAPVTSAPKLSFTVMDCRAGEFCQVIIKLSSPLAKSLTASWRTADEAAAGNPNYYAIAGKHYVSTSGTFTLNGGQTETRVQIKSIEWESSQQQTLHIPFSFSGCQYDGISTLCAQYL